ncbi:MAG: hypothetical protein V3U93_05395, partial [Alphaproteobacteria bacterium]
MRSDATAQKDPACGGANRFPGLVATLARFSDSENQASRFTPRLPGKPICRHQIDSIWSNSALGVGYGKPAGFARGFAAAGERRFRGCVRGRFMCPHRRPLPNRDS